MHERAVEFVDRAATRYDVAVDVTEFAEGTGTAVAAAADAVPPICHETAVPTVMDPTLTDYETVWAAAGTPSAMWPVDPARLRELADATAVDLTARGVGAPRHDRRVRRSETLTPAPLLPPV